MVKLAKHVLTRQSLAARGNVHSADDWDNLLLPEIDRQQAEGKRVAFRADAAFAKPEIYDARASFASKARRSSPLKSELLDEIYR